MKKEITECKNVSVGLVSKMAAVQAPAREVTVTRKPPPQPEEENED